MSCKTKPNCPECNSDKIISKGISWYCKDCGRWFIKKPRAAINAQRKRERLTYLEELNRPKLVRFTIEDNKIKTKRML